MVSNYSSLRKGTLGTPHLQDAAWLFWGALHSGTLERSCGDLVVNQARGWKTTVIRAGRDPVLRAKACECVHMHTCASAKECFMCVHTFVCKKHVASVCMCVFMCMSVHIDLMCVFAYMYVYTCTCQYTVYVYVHACMYAHVPECSISVYMCVCTHVSVYISSCGYI